MKNRRNLVLILAFLKVRAFTFDGEYMIISLVQTVIPHSRALPPAPRILQIWS